LELGLDTSSLRDRAFLCTGSRYLAPSGREVAGVFCDAEGRPQPWWMVRRETFDACLLDAARRAGAEVHEGHDVQRLVRAPNGAIPGAVATTAAGDERHFAGRAVVGADGASSIVARELGRFATPAADVCLAARTYVEGVRLPAPYLEVFTTSRTLPG